MPAPAMPPVVYVPCLVDPGTGAERVHLRTTKDGRTALLAYSALDRLVAGAGEVPWALMTVPDLQRVHDESPYDVLYLDVRIPEQQRGL